MPHLGYVDGDAREGMPARGVRVVGAAMVAAAVLGNAGCASSGAGSEVRLSLTPSASPSGPDFSKAVLWLPFDESSIDFDGFTVFPDGHEGPYEGRVMFANDGGVDDVAGPEGRGRAVAFPGPCGGPDCPRALVEVAHDPALDPGDRDFAYGATVRLAPDETTTGSNILQKGRFAASDGLWKLQVDNDAGHPSCVIRSGTTMLRVRSKTSIADSSWHLVVCRRDGDGISIEVDGRMDREGGELGPVSSDWPVRIGAPGVGEGDDQFHGQVDDVFLEIS